MPPERLPFGKAGQLLEADEHGKDGSDERDRPLKHLQAGYSGHSSPRPPSHDSEDGGPGSSRIEAAVDQDIHDTEQNPLPGIALGENRSATERSKSPARRLMKRWQNETGTYEMAYDRRTDVQQVVQTGPEQKITDPMLLRHGIAAQMFIFGTEGDAERHFKDFRKRDTPLSFFKAGRVFRTLWIENRGGDGRRTSISTVQSVRTDLDKRIFARVRVFVVIREAEHYCTALPVVLYGAMRASQSSWKKSNHGIIYTGQEVPLLAENEFPCGGEQPMRSEPIRVSPDNPGQKLDPASRLDYANVFTIHHDVKVQNFGIVHSKSMRALMRQFREVWKDRGSLNVVASIAPALGPPAFGPPVLGDGRLDSTSAIVGHVDHSEAGEDAIEEAEPISQHAFSEDLDHYQSYQDIAYPELQAAPLITTEDDNQHLGLTQSSSLRARPKSGIDREGGIHQRSRTVDDTITRHQKRRLSLPYSEPFADGPVDPSPFSDSQRNLSKPSDWVEEQKPEAAVLLEEYDFAIPLQPEPKHAEKAVEFAKQLRRLRRKVGDVLIKRTQWRYETQRLEYTRQYLHESLAPLMTALNTQRWIDTAPINPKGSRRKRKPRDPAKPRPSPEESSSQNAYSSSDSDILAPNRTAYNSITPDAVTAVQGTSDISTLYEQYMKDFRNIEAIEKGLKDVMAELNEQEYNLQGLLTKLTQTMQSAHFVDELRQQMLDEPLPIDYESSHAPSEPEELHPLVAEYFSRAGDVNVYYERLQELDDAYQEDIADCEFRRDFADPDPNDGLDDGIEAVERQYADDRMKLERDLENAREETARLAERCKLAGLNPQLYRHSETSLHGESLRDAMALPVGPQDPQKSMEMVRNWLHDINDTDAAHWEDPAVLDVDLGH